LWSSPPPTAWPPAPSSLATSLSPCLHLSISLPVLVILRSDNGGAARRPCQCGTVEGAGSKLERAVGPPASDIRGCSRTASRRPQGHVTAAAASGARPGMATCRPRATMPRLGLELKISFHGDWVRSLVLQMRKFLMSTSDFGDWRGGAAVH
jgi:hypothetical protein